MKLFSIFFSRFFGLFDIRREFRFFNFSQRKPIGKKTQTKIYIFFNLLQIPDEISGDKIEFYAKSEEIVTINVSTSVSVNRKVQSVYIQTDKGIYKQGQKGWFQLDAKKFDVN